MFVVSGSGVWTPASAARSQVQWCAHRRRSAALAATPPISMSAVTPMPKPSPRSAILAVGVGRVDHADSFGELGDADPVGFAVVNQELASIYRHHGATPLPARHRRCPHSRACRSGSSSAHIVSCSGGVISFRATNAATAHAC